MILAEYNCDPLAWKLVLKKHTGWAVQLWNDTRSAPLTTNVPRGVMYGIMPKIYILDDRFKILMFRIGTIQFQLGFKGDAVSQATFDTFFNGVAWRVDEIIQKFENEVVSCIEIGKIFSKNLVQPFIDPILRIRLQLEKILKWFYLNVKKNQETQLWSGWIQSEFFSVFFEARSVYLIPLNGKVWN